uniref:Interleukin 17d n=1 Tax=Scophthalmus maximus TaxID=52904 RepID=A0A8D3CYN3_SCOMX
ARLRTNVSIVLLRTKRCSQATGKRFLKATRTTRACQEPPEETLEQMFGRLSVGVMSAFHHALQLEPHDKLNLSCPTAAAARPPADGKARLPVNLRSVSPWAYRMLYDPTRFPRHIPEAYCLCSGCLLGAHRGEDSELYRSAPVYAPAVVLRRTGSCVGGRHSYTEIYVSVAVGCTCVPRPWEKGRVGLITGRNLIESTLTQEHQTEPAAL